MSQSLRQSELFAGQDWTVLYSAFTKVNLNAYDWSTIRAAMVDYIQTNYPEDFNDWIESSEFVAILDLIAYLGQMMAFRMDINARENFLDLARSRENVLRLARFLNYTPRRNYPARGLVKLTAIQSTANIVDSLGNNLNARTIKWNDETNPNWYEQFILILNNMLITTNPFGTPLKSLSIDGIDTQLYRFNSIPETAGNLQFSSNVNASSKEFDIVNVDFSKNQGFFERTPSADSFYHIVYRNDGNGNDSKDTGFFLMFKQGRLTRSEYIVEQPIENRVVDVDIENINETDVWVQSVDEAGYTSAEWTRVGFVPTDDISKVNISNDNVTYNSITPSVRNIFQVITRDSDKISIRFGDGRFGSIPLGNIRIWYRVSSPDGLTIRPENISNNLVNFRYVAPDGTSPTSFLSFSLQETNITSAPSETDADIKRRAAAAFATQGRMVNGDDYNVLPSTNNLSLKVKSINRVYSGHSRYIDLNDPTSTYQTTKVFSDDGILFKEFYDNYQEIPITSNLSTSEIVSNVLAPMITNTELRDFLYSNWLQYTGVKTAFNFEYDSKFPWWQQSTNEIYSSTGRFAMAPVVPSSNAEWEALKAPLGNHAAASSTERYLVAGSMVKFFNAGWVTISTVADEGNSFKASGAGQVVLNESVKTGDRVVQVLPSVRTVFTIDEFATLKQNLDNKRTFGIGFDFLNQTWYIIDAANIASSSAFDYMTRGSNYDSSWLIKCEFSTLNWRITTRGLRYIFESEKDVRFFFVNEYRVIDKETGALGTDIVTVLDSNLNPRLTIANDWTVNTTYSVGDLIRIKRPQSISDSPLVEYDYYECLSAHTSGSGFVTAKAELDNTIPSSPKAVLIDLWKALQPALGNDFPWGIVKSVSYDDGSLEARRACVSFLDSDFDGVPDDPESFVSIVSSKDWIIHQRKTDLYGYSYYELTDGIRALSSAEAMPSMDPGEIVWIFDPNTDDGYFYTCNLSSTRIPVLGRTRDISKLDDQMSYMAHRGRKDIRFKWKHYAPVDHRIDPAISNIIDVFVLSRDYYSDMQSWVKQGADPLTVPKVPSESQLKIAFSDLENYKMFSDQMVWRPVKFKLLFGNGADTELKAKIKVVKLQGTKLSDGEIKSSMIQVIQEFFDVSSWDFGETFYFTELAGYIHARMINSIASVVIVPLKSTQSFGELFEVRCQPDEMFSPQPLWIISKSFPSTRPLV